MCQPISIDYAVMEKSKNIVAVPLECKWSDLGDWNSVWMEGPFEENEVVVSENSHAIDCNNVLIRSESSDQQIVGLGLSDLIVVAMPDAVLVADKKRSQEVRQIVDQLEDKKIQQANILAKVYKPWGWYETLSISENCHVKKILVNPGSALSLQSRFRSEHWVVVKGEAKVFIESETKVLSQGQSIYVPLESRHRLENPGQEPMVLIEVQTGSYFGEDDIIRYEDLYSRTSKSD